MIRIVPPFSCVDHEFLYRVFALHESGHLVIFHRFGVEADARLELTAEGDLLGAVTVGEQQRLTTFDRACVGWAGIMAEYLLGYVLRPSREIPDLTVSSVREWGWAVRAASGLLSGEDRLLIALYRDSVKAAQFTFDALSGPIGSSLLYQQFEALVESFRKEHAAVRERNWTAPPAAVRLFARRVFGPCDVPSASE
jgi:hypothetical protein